MALRAIPGGRLVAAKVGVGVPLAELGVIYDGHQHVVEFVRGRADEFAERRQLLGLRELVFQKRDLFDESSLIRSAYRHRGLPLPWTKPLGTSCRSYLKPRILRRLPGLPCPRNRRVLKPLAGNVLAH